MIDATEAPAATSRCVPGSRQKLRPFIGDAATVEFVAGMEMAFVTQKTLQRNRKIHLNAEHPNFIADVILEDVKMKCPRSNIDAFRPFGRFFLSLLNDRLT